MLFFSHSNPNRGVKLLRFTVQVYRLLFVAFEFVIKYNEMDR